MSANGQADPALFGNATVACDVDAPGVARTLVAAWLDGDTDPQLRADAILLVSELVTNCVRHAGQPAGSQVRLSVAAHDGFVRVRVDDDGRGGVRRRKPGQHDGGFGLHLVDMLAADWGVRYEQGTRVWFDLTTHTAAS